MKVLSFALIADGSSDRSLIPIVTWAIRAVAPETVMSPPRFLARGGRSVEEAISGVIAGYQPDLVFVHRDAERLPLQDRRREIPTQDGVVPVIPVVSTPGPSFKRVSANPLTLVRALAISRSSLLKASFLRRSAMA